MDRARSAMKIETEEKWKRNLRVTKKKKNQSATSPARKNKRNWTSSGSINLFDDFLL